MGENNNTKHMEGSNKMIKTLIKIFMPSPRKLANMAAEKIQKAVNESNKADIIAKCANIAASITDIQKFVSDTLMDGKVSDAEGKRIEDRLIPLFEKVVELACK